MAITPTLGAVTLTGCSQISDTMTANIIILPMPLGDSSETEVFDFGGVEQLFTITGTFAASTIAAVKTKVDDIKLMVDGDQSSTVNFFSEQTGDISVLIMGTGFNWDVPGFKCDYTIKLGRGNAI